jgi:UDP-N-acetylmuramoyl-L-alanyl-D-glutamate--2,6-diaminopimelate ligase
MHLSFLLDRLDQTGLLIGVTGGGRADTITIDHLADDSRAVGPDGCFVAVRGVETDGHLFIDKAVQNGAIAIVCEAVPEDASTRFSGTAFVRVSDSRKALAEGAAAYYGGPSQALRTIGITGTNGKTTTAFLVHHLLTILKEKAGLIGTIETRIGEEAIDAALTTPGALELQELLRRMVDENCGACVMEVSSHALAQERVGSITFDVGAFTNLTVDHLDYHGTLQAYRAAKKKLFDGLPDGATAVYNLDDEAGPTMVADTKAHMLSYGMQPDADIQVEVLANRLNGLRLRLDGMTGTFRLVGGFNAYNLAAAYGAVRALGYPAEDVLQALEVAPPVPGRFEQIAFDDGPTVIVDYAHTPDALENILKAIRNTKKPDADLWCLFGCGGDRDASKRRTMGSIAERLADHVIVTSDNPRTEEPEAIMNDIRRGMNRPNDAQWLPDRDAAIQAAAAQAAPGDVVLIAGKGHEPYQIIGTERRPFDDRQKARQYFGKR